MKLKLFGFSLMVIFCAAMCGSSTDNSTPSPPRTSDQALTTAKSDATPLDSPIKWYSYNEGLSLSKHQKKKIFLTFYADWCRYCKEMDQKTFKDASVASFLNEHFIAIKVNSDKETKLSEVYQVRGLPVSWFISETGETIGSQPGFIPADSMLALLKYIHTDSYKKMKYSDFLKTM